MPAQGADLSFQDGLSLLEPNQPALRGELPINPARDILSLENLGTLLVTYGQATTDVQNTLAKEIEKTANGLLKRERDVNGAELKDSLRTSPDERQILQQKAKKGDPTATRTLALFTNTTDKNPDVPLGNPVPQHRDVINQLSPTEQKIVGAWSWTYIEGVGRIIFTADHRVKVGFPPDDKDGRRIGDDEFDIVQAGTWRLEGEVLITEMDNRPLIKILEHLDPSNLPPLEKKVERRKIVKIDGDKIAFDNGSSFDRVKR